MSSHKMRRKTLTVLGFVSLAALSACGKQGALERPAPLFGSRARAEYEAERAQEARDDAQRRTQGATANEPETNRTNSNRDVLDPNQRLSPASADPLPGTPNPFGAPVSTTPAR
jgi:predicted small lipoprotein YifL